VGLFSRNKKPELPRLPRLPDIADMDSDLPSYEEQLKDQPIVRPKPIQLPPLRQEIRKPMFPRLSDVRPSIMSRSDEVPVTIPMNDKPIFVKIEKYKEALKTVKEIKDKVSEAENVLRKIHNIRRTEEAELLHWEKELTDIKTKMVKIDRGLFEV
jgi:hypothetical protein